MGGFGIGWGWGMGWVWSLARLAKLGGWGWAVVGVVLGARLGMRSDEMGGWGRAGSGWRWR